MKINDHVEILLEGLSEANKVGRIVNIDGPIVYVSNCNMPFMGTFCGQMFTKNEVRVMKGIIK